MANFTIFNKLSVPRITIKNARFLNFSTELASKTISNIYLTNCSIENSTFRNIPYIFSMNNNLAKFTNLTINNCIFEQTSVIAFDASNVEFSTLNIHNTSFISSTFTYSICQLMKVNSLTISNSTIYDSCIFDMYGASGYSFSIDLSDSCISNTDCKNSFLISSDFLSATSVSNLSFINTKRLSLYRGPSSNLQIEEVNINDSLFDNPIIESSLIHSVSIKYSSISNSFLENGLINIKGGESYEESGSAINNTHSKVALNVIGNKNFEIESVSYRFTFPAIFEFRNSSGTIESSNFSSGTSAVTAYSSKVSISDSNFAKLNETSVVSDSASFIYIKKGCNFSDTVMIKADGVAEVDESVLAENKEDSINDVVSIVHEIKDYNDNEKVIGFLFISIIGLSIILLIRLSKRKKRISLPTIL